jgi:hypothetical protein
MQDPRLRRTVIVVDTKVLETIQINFLTFEGLQVSLSISGR